MKLLQEYRITRRLYADDTDGRDPGTHARCRVYMELLDRYPADIVRRHLPRIAAILARNK